jgi:3'-phosphoadenosine 5'-phosphosulfate sulfotransferase (PAPS reductase)/FAD synthetase
VIPAAIQALVDRGALFVCNHSGGKDSQAMYLKLRAFVPRAQLVLVHADLGRVEWAGAQEHIRATTDGEPLHVCRSRRDLLQMIRERGMFPSPTLRQCTSDLKRGPIEKTIRMLVERRRQLRQVGADIVVNCMGMRAQESSSRAKLQTFKPNPRNSKNGREWYDWLPIHEMLVGEVFATIAAAGQQPHPVYAQGMTRFSCCFCVMASEHDLRTAATLNPGLYREYVELERSTGQVMLMPSKSKGRRTLEQVTGVYINELETA